MGVALKPPAPPSNLLRIDDIFKAVFDNTKTDMTLSEIMWLGMRAIKLDKDSISMDMLPGEAEYILEKDYKGGVRLSYFIPDEEKVLAYINEKINPFTTDITKLKTKDVSALRSH